MPWTWLTRRRKAWIEAQMPGYIEARANEIGLEYITSKQLEYFEIYKTRRDEVIEENEERVEDSLQKAEPGKKRKKKKKLKLEELSSEDENESEEAKERRKKAHDAWYGRRSNSIKNWFFNNHPSARRDVQCRFVFASTPARTLSELQIYSKKYYDTCIKARVEEALAEQSVEEKDKLALRNQITREAYENESDEVKKEIRELKEMATKEKTETLAELQAMFKDEETRTVERSPQEMARFLNILGEVLKSILETLGPSTGWCWSIFGGGPDPRKPDAELSTATYHSGTTATGLNFAEYSPLLHQLLMVPYGEFLNEVYPADVRLRRTIIKGDLSIEAELQNISAKAKCNGGVPNEDLSREDEAMEGFQPASTQASKKSLTVSAAKSTPTANPAKKTSESRGRKKKDEAQPDAADGQAIGGHEGSSGDKPAGSNTGGITTTSKETSDKARDGGKAGESAGSQVDGGTNSASGGSLPSRDLNGGSGGGGGTIGGGIQLGVGGASSDGAFIEGIPASTNSFGSGYILGGGLNSFNGDLGGGGSNIFGSGASAGRDDGYGIQNEVRLSGGRDLFDEMEPIHGGGTSGSDGGVFGNGALWNGQANVGGGAGGVPASTSGLYLEAGYGEHAMYMGGGGNDVHGGANNMEGWTSHSGSGPRRTRLLDLLMSDDVEFERFGDDQSWNAPKGNDLAKGSWNTGWDINYLGGSDLNITPQNQQYSIPLPDTPNPTLTASSSLLPEPHRPSSTDQHPPLPETPNPALTASNLIPDSLGPTNTDHPPAAPTTTVATAQLPKPPIPSDQPASTSSRSKRPRNDAEEEPKQKRTRKLRHDVPDWVTEHKTYLLEHIDNPAWLDCIELWYQLELEGCRPGIETKGRFSAVTKRPPELAKWFRPARAKAQKMVDLDVEKGFGSSWIEWWKELQPAWRENDPWAALPTELGPTQSLKSLKKTGHGVGSLIAVVVGLRWWRDESGTEVSWATAVESVSSCLRHLVERT